MRSRTGATAAEAIVALLVGLLVLQLAVGILARERRVVASLVRRAESLGAARIARHVLATDLGAASGPADVEGAAPDSVALRVMRGLAVVCAVEDDGALLVAVRGHRLPDPSKDSVLALVPPDGWRAVGLLDSRPTAGECGGDGARVLRWSLEGGGGGVVLGRYFERGVYYLADGALRYRRGRSGRQPLTPEVVGSDSRFVVGGPVPRSAELSLLHGGPPWRVRLER